MTTINDAAGEEPAGNPPRLLSGKEASAAVEADLIQSVEELKASGIAPALAVVRVGEDPASETYVRNKIKAAERVGIRSIHRHLPESTTQENLEAEIALLNKDRGVHGILCQLPLPDRLDPNRIVRLIDAAKDVDCFHPYNVGLLAMGEPRFLPCTPAGILELLERGAIEISGKRVVILGRSNIVGRPLSLLLSHKGRDATVTLCHSRTPHLPSISRQADILVAATGIAEWVTADMVRDGAVVIDVGMNRVRDASRKSGYRLCGDVHFESVAPKTLAITPVPGGVGPMTIAMLLRNTVQAARLIGQGGS